MTEQSEQVGLDGAIETIRRLLVEVLGDDLLLDIDISAETSIADDIELESIDLVVLTEKLEEAYDKELDFAGWIGEMELDDIIALTVGDLAKFVVDSIAAPAPS